jgi:hypothetical protein
MYVTPGCSSCISNAYKHQQLSQEEICISCIQIELDFILAGAKLHSSPIMTFVDVFINIFDSLDRSNRLHIDMTLVFPEQPCTVWYNPTVVYFLF